MYGKLFASLYTGSMIGAGPVPFALMPYVIANAKPDRELGGYVELNPVLLSAIIGASKEDIEKGIEYLCSPDPNTRTPDEGGRRLVKVAPFAYRVVNFAKYRAIRDEEERREQNRINQEKHRERVKAKASHGRRSRRTAFVDQSKTVNGRLIEEAMARGDTAEADRLQAMFDAEVDSLR